MALIILTIVLFIYPLRAPHKIMSEAKEDIQSKLSREHNEVYNKMVDDLNTKREAINDERFREIEQINILYERAEKMPVWPFDLEIIGWLLGIIILPLTFIVIEQLLVVMLG